MGWGGGGMGWGGWMNGVDGCVNGTPIQFHKDQFNEVLSL